MFGMYHSGAKGDAKHTSATLGKIESDNYVLSKLYIHHLIKCYTLQTSPVRRPEIASQIMALIVLFGMSTSIFIALYHT